MSMILSYLLYWFIIVPWSYFFKHFLTPKFKYTTIYSSLTFAVFTIIILVFFYENIAIKLFMTVIAIFTCILFFYEGSKVKKLISPIILVAASSLAEVPVDLFLFKILDIGMNDKYSTVFFVCQIIANINMMIICYVLAKITKYKLNGIRKYPVLIVVISVNFFCISTCMAQLQVMEMMDVSLSQRFILGGTIFIALIITDVYFTYFFREIHRSLKVKISMQKIEQEYLLVLNAYIDINDKMYRYARHDIMNQILQYSQIRSNKNEDKKIV